MPKCLFLAFLGKRSLAFSNIWQYKTSFEYGAIFVKNLNLGIIRGLVFRSF